LEVDWHSLLSLFVVIQELLLTKLFLLLLPTLSGEAISFNFGKGGGGEGLPLAAADNADGERVFRRDSAMESDTACDLGDVVFGGGGGGGEGGVVREDDGGERGALSLADAEL
jgi:hypothetical protein